MKLFLFSNVYVVLVLIYLNEVSCTYDEEEIKISLIIYCLICFHCFIRALVFTDLFDVHIVRDTGRKVEDPDMLERIRLTIINNLLKYHPVSLFHR